MFIFFFIPLGRSVSITRKKKLDPTQEVMLELGVVLQKKRNQKIPLPIILGPIKKSALNRLWSLLTGCSAHLIIFVSQFFSMSSLLQVIVFSGESLITLLSVADTDY